MCVCVKREEAVVFAGVLVELHGRGVFSQYGGLLKRVVSLLA